MKKIIVLFTVCLCGLPVFSQQQTFLSINANFEKMERSVGTKYGVSAEFQFAKNWGYEIGLNAHNIQMAHQNINLRYATIPVLFKFYSTAVNVSAGFNVDYYLGWENIGGSQLRTASFQTPLWNSGFMLEVSKDISLSRHLTLEPEISINPMWHKVNNDNSVNFGIGLKLKHILRSK